MNSSQFIRWLRREHGAVIEDKGGRHHKLARLGGRKAVIPTHGGQKQLGKGLMLKIMRELGIQGPPPN